MHLDVLHIYKYTHTYSFSINTVFYMWHPYSHIKTERYKPYLQFSFQIVTYKHRFQPDNLLWIWGKCTTKNYVNGCMNITTCCLKGLNIQSVICKT